MSINLFGNYSMSKLSESETEESSSKATTIQLGLWPCDTTTELVLSKVASIQG